MNTEDDLMELSIDTLEEVQKAIDEMIDEMYEQRLPIQYLQALGEVMNSIANALSLMKDGELRT